MDFLQIQVDSSKHQLRFVLCIRRWVHRAMESTDLKWACVQSLKYFIISNESSVNNSRSTFECVNVFRVIKWFFVSWRVLWLFVCLLAGKAGWQPTKGSPTYPCWQEHTALWLTTLQTAKSPQDPGHGSTHLWLWQANALEHSAWFVHSGRQFGARPIKLGKQEQAAWPLICLHWELGPQGEGTQGLTGGDWVEAKKFKKSKNTKPKTF